MHRFSVPIGISICLWSLGASLVAGSLVVVPDDLQSAFENLKLAESRKDPAEIKKLAVETCALARELASVPPPEDPAARDAWTRRVAWAREIEVHTEYALSAAAVEASPEMTVDLIAALERQNPESRYLEDSYGRYLVALSRTGAAAKIPAVAEKALAHFPENEDLLLVLADSAFTRKDSDRALLYAERLLTVLNKHSRPDGVAASDWERKRSAAMGRGYWIAGLALSDKSQFFKADQRLRAALPYVKGNDAMMQPALFYLGIANYQLGKTMLKKAQVLEAVAFSHQAAAMEGPYQVQARHNAQVMKNEADRMR